MAVFAKLCLLIMQPWSMSRPLRQIVCTISQKKERIYSNDSIGNVLRKEISFEKSEGGFF